MSVRYCSSVLAVGSRRPSRPNGLPNCVVVSARTSVQDDAQGLAICQECAEPGLEPFIAPVPLERIGAGLSSYPCLCGVMPLPSNAVCPSLDSSTASWCYTVAPAGSAPCSGPILGFSPLASSVPVSESGTLYIACFEPEAGP